MNEIVSRSVVVACRLIFAIICISGCNSDSENTRFDSEPSAREGQRDISPKISQVPEIRSSQDVFKAISGRWLSEDKSTSILIRGENAMFDVNISSSLFSELDGLTKVLRETTLSFDHDKDNYHYDIYWIWDNPNCLSLLKKEWATGKYSSMEFERATDK
jgi:hypothetical protein